MISFGFILLSIYSLTMVYYAIHFNRSNFNKKKISSPKTSFSIVIAFRNEALYLKTLLEHLKNLEYPGYLFEVLLVNDHSEDDSLSICQEFIKKNKLANFKILQNQNLAKSPKKSSILTALTQAKFDYILFTDADCMVPKTWLNIYNNKLRNGNFDFVAGPVCIKAKEGFWENFQILDVMCLQVIGLGSFKPKHFLMCNAANMCIKKTALKETNALEKHKHITSGDDVFTLEHFRKRKKNISALIHKEAIVATYPQQNFNDLTQQRVRWASKSKHYTNKGLIFIGLIVLSTNLFMVLVLPFSLQNPIYALMLWGVKIGVDSYVLFAGKIFFGPSTTLKNHLKTLIVYPFVTSYFGIKSFTGKFDWKGRAFKV
jgi:cellulose synthase/poly-beta-1,6-N-acetylglucosamine synthase-like glycosyltransferase